MYVQPSGYANGLLNRCMLPSISTGTSTSAGWMCRALARDRQMVWGPAI